MIMHQATIFPSIERNDICGLGSFLLVDGASVGTEVGSKLLFFVGRGVAGVTVGTEVDEFNIVGPGETFGLSVGI